MGRPASGSYGCGMFVPYLADAIVIAQAPPNGVIVNLQGGFGMQGLPIPVQVLSHGHRDAVYGESNPLPRRGTHGLVGFTRGDIRNGRWLGAHDPALPTSQGATPQEPNRRQRVDFSGFAMVHTEGGTTWMEWPDGTVLQIGPGTVTPMRTVVTSGQVAQQQAFPLAQRVASQASPFPMSLTLGSGASLSADASGNWTVSAAPGMKVMIDGAEVDISNGGTLQQLLNATAYAVFNGHTHAAPNGATGAPNQQMTETSLTQVLKAQ
jgi:hypothetical protein